MRLILSVLMLSLTTSAFAADGFKLSSADIKPNSTITNKHVFKGFGCEGDNISPALSWSGAPKDVVQVGGIGRCITFLLARVRLHKAQARLMARFCRREACKTKLISARPVGVGLARRKVTASIAINLLCMH
jgi:hypothetical protein